MNQNILVDKALTSIWCNPNQDFQHTITPSRYSPQYGSIGSCQIYNFTTPMPVVSGVTYYHVFHLGKVPPVLLQIDPLQRQYQNLQTICNRKGTVLDVFLSNGAKVPPAHCWVKRLFDDNLILVVESHPGFNFGQIKILNDAGTITSTARSISNDVLTVRFYNNDMPRIPGWTSAQSNPIPVTYLTAKITSQSDFNSFRANANTIIASYGGKGAAMYYLDGMLTSSPNLGWSASTYLGKFLTIYYDGTIIKQFSATYTGLKPFQSLIDNVPKLVYMTDASYDGIDYFDDIDFYITVGSGISKKGVFFSTTDPARPYCRMLTHNAYALNSLALANQILKNVDFAPTSSLKIEAYVRMGGMKTDLVNNVGRIYDLYRMPFPAIVGAVTGLNSVIPEWSAPQLEKSAYPAAMRSSYKGLTLQLAEKAMGYYETTAVAFNPLQRTVAGQIDVNAGYSVSNPAGGTNGSIFGYDSNSLLLGGCDVALDGSSPINLPSAIAGAALTETVNLPLSATYDGTYHNQDVADQALAAYGFEVYACGLVHGVPNEFWSTITDSHFYQYFPNGTGGSTVPAIVFNYALLAQYNLFASVRIANSCLFYAPTINNSPYPGYMSFTIGSTVDWQGVTVNRPQSIPGGNLDVWMDGALLIEGIDYYAKWPTVVVVKVPASAPGDATFAMRTYGLAAAGAPPTHRLPAQIGFARGGLLSTYKQYVPRNDRNLRVNVAGKIYLPSEVNFAEDVTYGQSPTVRLVPDGSPYSIDDYRFQIEPLIPENTQKLLAAATDLDTRISNYVTEHQEQYWPPVGSLSSGKYLVFSPLISAIISCFLNSTWTVEPALDTPYDNADIANWLAPLIWLLPFDPAVNNADRNFVDIRPHQLATTVGLPADQFEFLLAVNAIYLKNAVNVNGYCTVI